MIDRTEERLNATQSGHHTRNGSLATPLIGRSSPSEVGKVSTRSIYGQSLVSTSTLTGGTYQGNGTWTNAYFTK